MVTEAIVESIEDFDSWLGSQKALSATPAAGEPIDATVRGRSIYLMQGCGACHALSDTGAAGVLGPRMDGIGASAATRVPGLDARAYLTQSILQPNEYVLEGFSPGIMPANFDDRLSQAELEALVKYLLTQ